MSFLYVRRLNGFTLVELLLTVSIIALLITILLPSLGRARRSALAAASSSNVAVIARAMAVTVSEDAQGQLVTGAFDWYRDGDVREVGFVADMADQGILTGDILDPSNRHSISQTVLDWAGVKESSENTGPWWLKNSLDTTLGTSASLLTVPTSLAELKEIFRDGYNTNYATSWQLVRGDPIRTSRDTGNNMTTDGTGPLTIDQASQTPGGAGKLPLLAEARASTINEGFLGGNPSPAIEDSPNADIWANAGAVLRNDCVSLFAGEDAASDAWCVKSFCNGMHAEDLRSTIPNKSPDNISHEFSAFWPHHLSKRKDVKIGNTEIPTFSVEGFCNLMMADFTVRRRTDKASQDSKIRGDGWLGAYPTVFDGSFKDFQINDNLTQELGFISVGLGGSVNVAGGAFVVEGS